MNFSVESLLRQSQDEPPHASGASLANDEAYKRLKQQERDAVLQLRSTALLRAFSSTEYFTAFLDAQARFPQYSAGNVLLIHAQRADATLVASYADWTRDLRGEYKRGIDAKQKGIAIFLPREYMSLSGGRQVRATGFDISYVFDVSQTNGVTIPVTETARYPTQRYIEALLASVKKRLIQDTDEARAEHAALDPNKQYIQFCVSDDIPSDVGAVYLPESRMIRLRPDMTQTRFAAALTMCLTQDALSFIKRDYKAITDTNLEGVGAAYIVLTRFGQAASELPRIVPDPWVYDHDNMRLSEALDSIRLAANAITERVARVSGVEAANVPVGEGSHST